MKNPRSLIIRVLLVALAAATLFGPSPSVNAETSTTTTTPATTTTVHLYPSAPLNVKVRVVGTYAVVSWSAPLNPGTHPVLGYTLDSSSEELSCYTTALSCRVGPLVPGIPYKFRVRADSLEGLGALSEWSRQVTRPFWFENKGTLVKLTSATKPSVKISLHTGVNVISGKVWVGVMTPRGVGTKQIVRYVFALVDAEKNTVATFATSTHRENVVIGYMQPPAGRYQLHILATLRSGTTLTSHGVWLTVK